MTAPPPEPASASAGCSGTPLERTLARRLPALREAVRPAGMVWVAWPKWAARTDTELR